MFLDNISFEIKTLANCIEIPYGDRQFVLWPKPSRTFDVSVCDVIRTPGGVSVCGMPTIIGRMCGLRRVFTSVRAGVAWRDASLVHFDIRRAFIRAEIAIPTFGEVYYRKWVPTMECNKVPIEHVIFDNVRQPTLWQFMLKESSIVMRGPLSKDSANDEKKLAVEDGSMYSVEEFDANGILVRKEYVRLGFDYGREKVRVIPIETRGLGTSLNHLLMECLGVCGVVKNDFLNV